MNKAVRTLWRRYRALPGRAQGGIAAALVVLVVIAAAAGGSGTKPAHTVGVGGPSAAVTTTTANTTPMSTPRSTSEPTASSSTAPAPAPATSAPPTTVAFVSGAAPSTCHVRGTGLYVLPDPACTPGATNPDVTQADIATTICSSGWTATIRPPESYTEPLKLQQMSAYGDTAPVSSFEEDHLISLELGGSPRDPRNLWPEPGASPNPKDAVENAARRAVCNGTMSLAAAQQGIASNWISLGEQLGVTTGTAPAPTPDTDVTPPATITPSSSAPTPSPGGCSPTTSKGNCYKAGEYCPKADAGMTGTDAGGNRITCEDVNGTWRWE